MACLLWPLRADSPQMLVAIANAATKDLAISALRVASAAEVTLSGPTKVKALAFSTLLVGRQLGNERRRVASALALSTLAAGKPPNTASGFVSKASPNALGLGILPIGLLFISWHGASKGH